MSANVPSGPRVSHNGRAHHDIRYRDIDGTKVPDGLAPDGFGYSDRTPNGLRRSAELQRQADQVAVRREELSQTVSALAEKFDVKARAREAASELRETARRRLRPQMLLTVMALAGGVTAAVCAAVFIQRRRVPRG